MDAAPAMPEVREGRVPVPEVWDTSHSPDFRRSQCLVSATVARANRGTRVPSSLRWDEYQTGSPGPRQRLQQSDQTKRLRTMTTYRQRNDQQFRSGPNRLPDGLPEHTTHLLLRKPAWKVAERWRCRCLGNTAHKFLAFDASVVPIESVTKPRRAS